MSRSTAGISINGRPGWESSRTFRPVNNSYRTFAGSSNDWPRRVSHRKPFATTWTTSGASAARSFAICITTRRFVSFPLSGSSDSLSMNLGVPPFTTAQTSSSAPSTPPAASCIASSNPDPQIPQTSHERNRTDVERQSHRVCLPLLFLRFTIPPTAVRLLTEGL
jgi:hypothetical protein